MEESKIINKVKQSIKEHTKATISLEDLYTMVVNNSDLTLSDLHFTHMDLFSSIVNTLISENIISKRGKKTDERGLNPLNLNYNNLLKEKKETLTEDDKMFLHSLNKDIDVALYFRKVEKFREDKEKLKILSEYLNNATEDTLYMGINERSYELFGYEKELVNDKNGLLSKTKVPLDKLKCFEQYTPIQCHILKNFYTKEVRAILIIENLNTYNSIVSAAIETDLGEYLDMIVYGGGNMISGNFRQHLRYDIKPSDYIYYFGDIDPEGICIYKRLKDANPNLNIKLCNELYQLAITIGKSKGLHDIHNENQTMPNDIELDSLLGCLKEPVANDFRDIIKSGKYIPQEAVNYVILLREIQKI